MAHSNTSSRAKRLGALSRGKLGRRKGSCVELVRSILEWYAARGVFRGFSLGAASRGKASFKLLWHRDRAFELVVDEARKRIYFPVVLPLVPSRSPMYKQFKEFVASRQSNETPAHRRIDTRKVQVECRNRGGNVSLAMVIVNGDYEYGARKLIHLVHEIFLGFLADGPYFDYMTEAFDMNPDGM